MKLQLKKQEKKVVAKFSGELDHHSAASIRRRLDGAIADAKINELELDFSELSFMDSSGIGVIIGRYKTIKGRGGSVYVHGANPHIDKILKVSGMYKILRKA